MYCFPLESPLRQEEVGAKAANLSAMIRNGFPVPPGFVVADRAFQECGDTGGESFAALRREIALGIAGLRGEQVMVRSSAIGEDSHEASFAGQLDSFLCNRTIDDVMAALLRCWASYHKENVQVYQQQKKIALRGMGAVVQELVDPDYAGVLFTRSYDNPGEMLCEFVPGHGEKLVSGEADPMRFRCGRDTGTPDAPPPFDFSQLYAHALRLESVFGAGLDIEWTMRGGACHIVQSRPITLPSKGRPVYWSNTNVNENYPGPITPLLYSVARESYYHYFRNLSSLLQVPPQAIRELEPDYTNIIGAFGCRMYYNMTSIHNVIGRSPFAALLRGAFDNFVGYQEGEAGGSRGATSRDAVRFVRRFAGLNYRLGRNVREFEERASEFERKSAAARDPAALRECFHQFIEIRMHSWYRASLADFFAMVYHGLIGVYCRKYFGEDHQGIHNTIIQAIPGLVSSRPIAEIWKIGEMIKRDPEALAILLSSPSEEVLRRFEREERFAIFGAAIKAYLDSWGFRCSGELMLTEDNFCDAPETFIDLLRGYIGGPGDDPDRIIRAKAAERIALMRRLRGRLVRRRGLLAPVALVDIALLQALVRLCFSGIASRERVRLKQAHLYYRFKLILRRIGAEFARAGLLEQEEDILFLRYQEIEEHLATSDMLAGTLKGLVALRREEFQRASQLHFPDDFSSQAGEYPTPERVARNAPGAEAGQGAIKGLSACGGLVRGRVRVLSSVMELGRIEKGDILVTRQTDPGWAAVFPLIRGLVVERGGMLSHGAIVAREFGIPAVVGVPGATSIFVDGEEIELNADRGEIYRNSLRDTPGA